MPVVAFAYKLLQRCPRIVLAVGFHNDAGMAQTLKRFSIQAIDGRHRQFSSHLSGAGPLGSHHLRQAPALCKCDREVFTL
ncbi:hypothetical protein MES4922_670006 [Mesorhizobium ventifaucium]|uniref:Uncharacterized protein n=1 Tax=Mesorhizobium ventifaucium TaxID=666020 RepID=A0ABM9EDZ6_9HYPH|nr:hypothetical protein MES4922_670006 [Mesorhizobium ventifaucium]